MKFYGKNKKDCEHLSSMLGARKLQTSEISHD